jgi:hypothetical protein
MEARESQSRGAIFEVTLDSTAKATWNAPNRDGVCLLGRSGSAKRASTVFAREVGIGALRCSLAFLRKLFDRAKNSGGKMTNSMAYPILIGTGQIHARRCQTESSSGRRHTTYACHSSNSARRRSSAHESTVGSPRKRPERRTNASSADEEKPMSQSARSIQVS